MLFGVFSGEGGWRWGLLGVRVYGVRGDVLLWSLLEVWVEGY